MMEHQEERKEVKKSSFRPIDSETIHWLIQNHALSYYQAKTADEKSMILNRIEADCKSRGKHYTADEISTKFKSLRRSFSKSKNDFNKGVIGEIKWVYYKDLSQIMDSTTKKRIIMDSTTKKKMKKCKSNETPLKMSAEMKIKLEPEVLLNELEMSPKA